MANYKNKKSASNVCFTGERSESIAKIENNTGGWRFFSYIYNASMFRTLGLQFLMLLFFIPAVFVILWQSSQLLGLTSQLPVSNSLGLGISPWFGLDTYLSSNTAAIAQTMYLLLLVAIPVVTIAISGGFAVIRDAYWTGKLRVCTSFFRGVAQTGLKFLPFTFIFALGLMGTHYLGIATEGMAGWIKTIISIVVLAVLFVVLLIGFVYVGTSTLYKQSFVDGFKNALRFTFKKFLSHAVTLFFTLFPIGLVAFSGSMGSLFSSLVIILFIMFGMLWIGLVWMIHIIRSTAPYAKK